MPKVKVGDINMYYEIHGKGEPLVIMGGGGWTIASLSHRIQIFSPEYQIIVFECRGTGRSDAPDIPYTMEMFADDLAGLLDAIDISSTHIFGESFGGEIAQYFASGYPDRVRSLILMSTYCGRSHGITNEEQIEFSDGFAKMTPEDRARRAVRLFVTPDYADKNPDFVQRMMKAMIEHIALSACTLRSIKAETTTDTYERLPQIKAPTLIIHGDSDNAFPVENARILASRIPNAELVILKGTGHFMLEAGEELNRIVLDFLRRHSTIKA